MERLKEAVLQLYTNNTNVDPSSHAKYIQDRLQSLFPSSLHIPIHPSYAEMVTTAIGVLNEEGGSNEASISNYIRSNYEDLPWAQSRLLTHHLNKLIKTGEIICDPHSLCYLLPNPKPNPNPNPTEEKKQKSKGRRGRKPYKKKCEHEQLQMRSVNVDEDPAAVIEVEPLQAVGSLVVRFKKNPTLVNTEDAWTLIPNNLPRDAVKLESLQQQMSRGRPKKRDQEAMG